MRLVKRIMALLMLILTFFVLSFLLSGCNIHDSMFKKSTLPFDDDLYFTMSFSEIKEKLGSPIMTEDCTDLSNVIYYTYVHDVFGKQATVTYGFYKTIFSLELVSVSATVNSINEKTAKDLIKSFALYFNDTSSLINGYYSSFNQSQTQGYCHFGINNGAIGLEYNIKYENGDLLFSGVASY